MFRSSTVFGTLETDSIDLVLFKAGSNTIKVFSKVAIPGVDRVYRLKNTDLNSVSLFIHIDYDSNG